MNTNLSYLSPITFNDDFILYSTLLLNGHQFRIYKLVEDEEINFVFKINVIDTINGNLLFRTIFESASYEFMNECLEAAQQKAFELISLRRAS